MTLRDKVESALVENNLITDNPETNKRRRALCAWSAKNSPSVFCNPAKLKYFLLYYEFFSVMEGRRGDITGLAVD